jgi:hypothetical protein
VRHPTQEAARTTRIYVRSHTDKRQSNPQNGLSPVVVRPAHRALFIDLQEFSP